MRAAWEPALHVDPDPRRRHRRRLRLHPPTAFHDTANAVATSIATGALKPRVAVMMSAVLNLVGAFVSIKVAATIAKGIVDPSALKGNGGLSLVFAALIGAIIWNLITWYFTLPSSSSHALTGGVIGAALVASGVHSVMFHGIAKSVIAPAILSPIICSWSPESEPIACNRRHLRPVEDIVASLAGGAGCAIAFGFLLIKLSRAQQTNNNGARVLNYGIVLVGGLFCVAAVVLGIHAMTTKS